MGPTQTKLATERNQRLITALAQKPGNNICADCKDRFPRWASTNLGIFICMNCASIHRKLGTHISQVKSVSLDKWRKEEIENMVGNEKANSVYNPNEDRYPPPPDRGGERDSELEKYIRSKYEHKSFMDKSAFVAMKLGPSRSASSLKSPSSSAAPVSSKPRESATAAAAVPAKTNIAIPEAKSVSSAVQSSNGQARVSPVIQSRTTNESPPQPTGNPTTSASMQFLGQGVNPLVSSEATAPGSVSSVPISSSYANLSNVLSQPSYMPAGAHMAPVRADLAFVQSPALPASQFGVPGRSQMNTSPLPMHPHSAFGIPSPQIQATTQYVTQQYAPGISHTTYQYQTGVMPPYQAPVQVFPPPPPPPPPPPLHHHHQQLFSPMQGQVMPAPPQLAPPSMPLGYSVAAAAPPLQPLQPGQVQGYMAQDQFVSWMMPQQTSGMFPQEQGYPSQPLNRM